MRKLTHLLLIALLFVANSAFAQIVTPMEVMSSPKYQWAKGLGETLEEADKNAIKNLVNKDIIVMSETRQTDQQTTDSGEIKTKQEFKEKSTTISNMYLKNVCREVLDDVDGKKQVLVYVTKEDWEARNKALKSKIEEYIKNGRDTNSVAYKLYYYNWANILLQTYPPHEEAIMVDGKTPAKGWIGQELRDILNDIEINAVSIEQDDTSTHYPYKVGLDFLYNDEPIDGLNYSYFDGQGYVDNESVRDGRGLVQVKDVSTTLPITIDCLNKELARQLDLTVFMLIDGGYAGNFEEANKTINLKIGEQKPKGGRNIAEIKLDSKVDQKHKEIANTYIEVEDKVESTRALRKIMDNIATGIKKKDTVTIRSHFTDEAWKQYRRIVANGKPIIARTPEYEFIKHDTISICNSIPLKLSFSGNRSFLEDVVFRINNRTKKIESVAYKLSITTEQKIKSMDWDDAARLTLITFLEDYRTAYCLEDIGYINKVFADDAYIIVGRVLKQSTRKFSDSANYAFNTTKTQYTHQTKAQYIYHLEKCFKSKEFVNLRFEECNVAKGFDTKEGIYAVQVKQLYYSSNYADEGILTLAIDMREDTHPLVRVRVWQDERDVNYTAEEMIEYTVAVKGSTH